MTILLELLTAILLNGRKSVTSIETDEARGKLTFNQIICLYRYTIRHTRAAS